MLRKLLNHKLEDQRGQILIVVLILVVVLLIIILAVVYNIVTDISQTTTERQYEEGYTAAEDELFQLATKADVQNDIVKNLANQANLQTALNNLSSTDGETKVTLGQACIGSKITGISGYKYHQTGTNSCATFTADTNGDGSADVLCHIEQVFAVIDQDLKQDETLEVNLLNGSTSWGGTIQFDGINPAISVAVVYKDASGVYTNERYGLGTSSSGSREGFSGNTVIIDKNKNPQFMRVRAVGGDMTLTIYSTETSNQLPSQMTDFICHGVSSEINLDNPSGSAVPIVYVLKMNQKRLPALFDYVLFVGDGGVTKN